MADNGGGKLDDSATAESTGLGTAIVQALVKQLGATTEMISSAAGFSVSITRATFTSRLPLAS